MVAVVRMGSYENTWLYHTENNTGGTVASSINREFPTYPAEHSE